MKRKRITAILLSAVLSISTCLPGLGITAWAAEDTETVVQEESQEEDVPEEEIQEEEIQEEEIQEEEIQEEEIQEEEIQKEEIQEEDVPEEEIQEEDVPEEEIQEEETSEETLPEEEVTSEENNEEENAEQSVPEAEEEKETVLTVPASAEDSVEDEKVTEAPAAALDETDDETEEETEEEDGVDSPEASTGGAFSAWVEGVEEGTTAGYGVAAHADVDLIVQTKADEGVELTFSWEEYDYSIDEWVSMEDETGPSVTIEDVTEEHSVRCWVRNGDDQETEIPIEFYIYLSENPGEGEEGNFNAWVDGTDGERAASYGVDVHSDVDLAVATEADEGVELTFNWEEYDYSTDEWVSMTDETDSSVKITNITGTRSVRCWARNGDDQETEIPIEFYVYLNGNPDLRERATVITLDEPGVAVFTDEARWIPFIFTPEVEGVYEFYAESGHETLADFYDGDDQFIGNYSGESSDFRFTSYLKAGEGYILNVAEANNEDCTATVYAAYVGDGSRIEGDMYLLGTATFLDDGSFELTPDESDKAGSAWLQDKIGTEDALTVNFSYWEQQDGADGMVLTFSENKGLGDTGGSLGFVEGATGVEFDEWSDSGSESNHIAVIKNDWDNHISVRNSDKVGDGEWHDASILYRDGYFVVYVDGEEALHAVGADLPSSVFVGVCAATGGASGRHLFRNLTVSSGVGNFPDTDGWENESVSGSGGGDDPTDDPQEISFKAWLDGHEEEKDNTWQNICIDDGNIRFGDVYHLEILTEAEDSTSLSYQWYQNDELIEGATDSGYDAVMYTADWNQYLCRITDESGGLVEILCQIYAHDNPRRRARTITLGQPETATFSEDERWVPFIFTPDKDGVYTFYTESDYNTHAELYDGNDTYVGYYSDGGEGDNFYFSANLNGGEDYLLNVAEENSEDCSVTVYVTKPAFAVINDGKGEDISILSGENVILEVVAESEEPITYTWYNGRRDYYDESDDEEWNEAATVISGENGASMTVSPTSTADYSCKITSGDHWGWRYFSVSVLQMRVWPDDYEENLNNQWKSVWISVPAGSKKRLHLNADKVGDGEITYHWYKVVDGYYDGHYETVTIDNGYWEYDDDGNENWVDDSYEEEQWVEDEWHEEEITEIEGLTGDTYVTDPINENTHIHCKAEMDGNDAYVDFYLYPTDDPISEDGKEILDEHVSVADAGLTFTGSELKPAVTVTYEGTTLTAGTDYDVEYQNNINAGTGVVTVFGKGDYTGTITKNFNIGKAAQTITASDLTLTYPNSGTISASGAKGTLSYTSSNTGVATVDDGGKVTAKAVGSADVTISAEATDNYYAATKQIKITVNAAKLADSGVTLASTSVTYTGSAQKPAVTVKSGSTTLKSGTDYTVAYSSNTNVGTAKVTVTGKGNYTGTVTKNFTITAAKLAAGNVTLASTSVTYTGSAQKPAVTVKSGSTTLKSGTDYTVAYSSNTNVGTAKVTVTGKGNYTGTVTKNFTIAAAKLAAGNVTLASTKVTYNGKAQKPAVTVKFGSTTLKSGTDYTLAYSANTKAGTAKATVTGKGNFTGTVTKTFTIAKAAQSITAKAAASSVAVGKTTTVSVTGAQGTVSYATSDKTIATVSAKGVVKGVKVGTVKITATAAATANYNKASKTVTIKIVPAATSSLTAANQAKGFKLTWKKVTGATGYIVYRGSTKIKTITSGSTVTYTDTAANTNGTKYTFKVVATASTGTSTLSKSVTTYRVARPAISSVTNSAAGKMTVKWGKNAKATGYQIQYGLKKDFSDAKSVSITKAATVSKVISSLTKGKTYYVRIRTYKTVSSTKYWSTWSASKTLKITK